MEKELYQLTDLTVKEILRHEVVLPSFYQEIFLKSASKLGIDVKEDDIYENQAEKNLNNSSEILKNSSKHADELTLTTSKAIEAIKNKDDAALDDLQKIILSLNKKMLALSSKVYKDSLTKLKNRLWLMEEFLEEDTFPYNGTLAFLDLNKFKAINDNYGHVIGDKVLIFLASYLKKIDENFIVMRYAGDEFLIISEYDIETLETKLTKAKNELNHKRIKATNGDLLALDFSFGSEAFETKSSFRETLEKADKKMYDMKENS